MAGTVLCPAGHGLDQCFMHKTSVVIGCLSVTRKIGRKCASLEFKGITGIILYTTCQHDYERLLSIHVYILYTILHPMPCQLFTHHPH